MPGWYDEDWALSYKAYTEKLDQIDKATLEELIKEMFDDADTYIE